MDSNLQINKSYSVLVAGDVDLKDFDINKKVKPYVVYQYNKRKEIRETAIKFYQEYIRNIQNDKQSIFLMQILNAKLEDIQEMSDEEYFEYATQGLKYDKKTGDAISDFNPKGKYKTLTIPTTDNAIPLKNNMFLCKVSELPEKNENNETIKKYSDYWDNTIMTSPNLKEDYLNTYKDKETYIAVMTEPLFYNAFVSNETGWMEQGDEDQIQWVLNFRKRFIENLPDNTILKVYIFTR